MPTISSAVSGHFLAIQQDRILKYPTAPKAEAYRIACDAAADKP
jgi:hypothetical protein